MELKMIGIYKITNLLNGKIYIGQSVHIEKRWQEHRNDYLDKERSKNPLGLYYNMLQDGIENFKFEVIEECSLNELNEREKYWIAYYNSYINFENSNGYNLTPGGQSKLYDPSIVLNLWDEGYSMNKIIQETGLSRSCIYNNLIGYSDFNSSTSHYRGITQSDKHNITEHTIYLYSLTGEYIQCWKSIKEAGRQLNISSASIGKCANKYRNSAGGYQWSREYVNSMPNLSALHKTSYPISIIQYDLDGNFILIHESIMSAASAVYGDPSLIRKALNKDNRTAYKFKWKTLDN